MTTVEVEQTSPTISSRRMPLTANIVEFKVGLFRSQSRLGRSVQSVGTFLLPGDTSSIRHPVSSGARSALFPGGGGGGGGGGSRLGRAIGNAAQRVRCPSGSEFGGRFANADLSNCGRQLFEDVSGGVTRNAERAGNAIRGATPNVPGSPDAPRGVVRAIDGRIIPMRAVQISRNASIPKVGALRSAQRESGIDTAASEVANNTKQSIRLVRRDGVQLQPVVSLDVLRSIRKNDDMESGAIVSNVQNPSNMGDMEVPVLLNTPISSAVFALGNGASVRLDKDRPLTIGERRKLTNVWGSLKDAEEFEYASRLSQLAEGSDALTFSSRFPSVEKPMERLSIQNADGQVRNVPRWVFEFYLSQGAPYRGNKDPWQIVISDGAKPNKLNRTPQATPGSKSLKSADRLSVIDQMLIRSSHDAWANSVDFKTAAFVTEKNYAGYVFEVKRAASVWDPDLPPSGGWRCPPGTRYGGRISDRFGRNCGYGISRRIAQGIENLGRNIGEGLDDRRDRRVAARAARVERRIARQEGRVERAQNRLERLRGQVGAPGVAGAADRAGFATRLERVADRVDGGYGRRQRRGPGVATRLDDLADRVDDGYGRNRRLRRRQRQQNAPGAATRLENFADRVDGGYGRDRKRRQRRGQGAATRLDNFADRVDGGYGRRRRRRSGDEGNQRDENRPGMATRLDRLADRVDFGYGRDNGGNGRGRRDDARVPNRRNPDRSIPNRGMRDDFRVRPVRPGQDDRQPADISDIPNMSDDNIDREIDFLMLNRPRIDGNVGGGRRHRERLDALRREREKRRRNGNWNGQGRDQDAIPIVRPRRDENRPIPDQGVRDDLVPSAPQRPDASADRYPPGGREKPVAPFNTPDAQMPENVRKVWREDDKDRRKEHLDKMSWGELRDYEARLKYERDLADRNGDQEKVDDANLRLRELANERRKRWRERRANEGQREPGQPAPRPAPRRPRPAPRRNEDTYDAERRDRYEREARNDARRLEEQRRRREEQQAPQPAAPRPAAPAVPQAQRDADGNWPEPRGLAPRPRNGDGLPEDVKNVWKQTDPAERRNMLMNMSDEDIETYRQRLIYEEDLARRISDDNERALAVQENQIRKREIQSARRERARNGNRNRRPQQRQQTQQPAGAGQKPEQPDTLERLLREEEFVQKLARENDSDARLNLLIDAEDNAFDVYKNSVEQMNDGPFKRTRLAEIRDAERLRAQRGRRQPAQRVVETPASAELAPGTPAAPGGNRRPAAPGGQGQPARPAERQTPPRAIWDETDPDQRKRALRDMSEDDLDDYLFELNNRRANNGNAENNARWAELQQVMRDRGLAGEGTAATAATPATASRARQEGERAARGAYLQPEFEGIADERDADRRVNALKMLADNDLDRYERYASALPAGDDRKRRLDEVSAEKLRRRNLAAPQKRPAKKQPAENIFRDAANLKTNLRELVNEQDDDTFAARVNALDFIELNEVRAHFDANGVAFDSPRSKAIGDAIYKREELANLPQFRNANERIKRFMEVWGSMDTRRSEKEAALRNLTEQDKSEIMNTLADNVDFDKYKHQINYLGEAFGPRQAARPVKRPAKRVSVRERIRTAGKRLPKRKADPALAKGPENDAKLGDIGKDGLPDIKNVPVGNAGITTQAKATKHLRDGGDIRDVPDKFLFKAMSSASQPSDGQPARFSKESSSGGVNGGPGNQFLFKDSQTGKQYFVKYVKYSYMKDEDLHEIVGNNLAGRLGFLVGEFRFASDNRVPIRGRRFGFFGRERPEDAIGRAVLMEHASNYVDGTLQNPRSLDPSTIMAKDRLRATALDYLMLNIDRHGGNYFVVTQDGKRKFVPIDPSLGFNPNDVFNDPNGGPSAMAGIDNFIKWLDSSRGGARGNGFVSSLRQDFRERKISRDEIVEEIKEIQDLLRRSQEERPLKEFAEAAVQAAGDNRKNTKVTEQFIERHDAFLQLTPEQIADAIVTEPLRR
jgi:hypothetical protein